ncbi:MAG: ABC transporter permease [Erysipelotrichia bacterium]|jgi:ABC-2 type transport system permease protein|nr:ABC transporter permease [Erysipelotrichia bacterium]
MKFFDKKNKILLNELIKTDFKLRYQGSAIGYLWSILKPVLLFLVLYVVFVRFLRFGAGVPHFAVALLLGMTVWNFFSEVTNMGMISIVSRGDLMRKISFSKPIIIFSVTANALINFGINLIVVLAFALVNGVRFTPKILFLPFLTVELILLSVGIAFLLATLFVKYRDLGPVWEVFLQAFMYATPIIYPVTMLFTNGVGVTWYARILMLNPMAQIIQDLRYTLIDPVNITTWQIVPMSVAWVPYILSPIIFMFGLTVFNKQSDKFAEII